MCLGDIGAIAAVGLDGTAVVRVNGNDRAVSLLLCPDVGVGEHVVVHSGFVLSRLEPDEAATAEDLRATPPP